MASPGPPFGDLRRPHSNEPGKERLPLLLAPGASRGRFISFRVQLTAMKVSQLPATGGGQVKETKRLSVGELDRRFMGQVTREEGGRGISPRLPARGLSGSASDRDGGHNIKHADAWATPW